MNLRLTEQIDDGMRVFYWRDNSTQLGIDGRPKSLYLVSKGSPVPKERITIGDRIERTEGVDLYALENLAYVLKESGSKGFGPASNGPHPDHAEYISTRRIRDKIGSKIIRLPVPNTARPLALEEMQALSFLMDNPALSLRNAA